MRRKIEVFTAGCPICDEQVQKIKDEACPSCDVQVFNVNNEKDALLKSREHGIKSLPAVVINGVLADCCSNKGIDMDILRSMGLGAA